MTVFEFIKAPLCFRACLGLAIWLGLLMSAVEAQQSVSLMKPEKPMLGWTFDNGQEFPGAKGGLEADSSVQHAGQGSLKLVGDFTGGGNYVQGAVDISGTQIRELSFWIKNFNHNSLTIRLIDASGRCHQFNMKAEATAEWQKIVLPLEMFFEKQATAEAVTSVLKYEAWGGDKGGDGKWKGPAKSFVVLIGKTDAEKVRTIWINGALAIPPLKKEEGRIAPAFQADFENSQSLAGWVPQGSAVLEGVEGFKGKQSLVLEKTETTLRDPVSITGPSFPVTGGKWKIQFAGKSDLNSQDNSYSGSLELEVCDASGKIIAKNELLSLFRRNPWKSEQVQVEFPVEAVSARLVARINKETVGKFWVDEISATAPGKVAGDDRVKRIMFSTSQPGNLLFPADPKEVAVEVWASQPLTAAQLNMTCLVRDYWGAEQGPPVEVVLKESGKKDNFFRYEGRADLATLPLEIGRYYEILGSISQPGNEPFTNYSSFAILPEAPANQFKPEAIPFTSRNWDNRLPDYVRLTHRLGIRFCGVWGKMDADPAKVEAPQIELVKELGMGVVTGSAASVIEQRSPGYEKLTEEALRQGVRNFLAKYGSIRPMIISLGNEPHTKGEAVKVDVEAYRVIYDEIKKIDPTLMVVGTSVGLDEENYFKFGFGKWCDAYDVHTYESPESVKHNLTVRYPEMFKKYGEIKPIWSTEIGLNSQGLTRLVVASTLYKKFAYFFAGGGANVSWFGLLYPDSNGTDAGSSGSAHNVFDCRYNKYAPKLDAVAYYNAVNAILTKKFVQEKTYGNDSHVFLFRDAEKHSLLIAFKDQGREDVFVPLKGVGEVKVIRIDGSLQTLHAGGEGLTLTLNDDPLLLLYDGGEAALPEKLSPPQIQLGTNSGKIDHGKASAFEVVLNGTPADRVGLRIPPQWTVQKAAAKDEKGRDVLRFELQPPKETAAREADLTVTLNNAEGKPAGALFYRPEMSGVLSPTLAALPAGAKGNSVKLTLSNHSPKAQELTWEVVFKGEQSGGGDAKWTATAAYFSEPPSGALLLEGNESQEIVLPLAGLEAGKNYKVEAVIRDASGRMTSTENILSGLAPPGK